MPPRWASRLGVLLLVLGGCSKLATPQGAPVAETPPAPTKRAEARPATAAKDDKAVVATGRSDLVPAGSAGDGVVAEASLGVTDVGVFGDLDGRVQLPAPQAADELLLDEGRRLLTAYAGAYPLKVYPVGAGEELSVGATRLRLRAGDVEELRGLLGRVVLRHLPPGQAPPPGDADGDGIADPLDLRIGAEKAALNGASYSDAYFSMPFPGGDPPRDRGACVDVIVRAARNAGFDLQAALQRDIAGAKSLYGVERPDANIDHRRVRVVIRYFERHWRAHSAALDDAADPLRPGDVVFLDTFPDRPGPDHVGVLVEARGKSGHPLVINNWTTGYTTRAMDLLGFVPVTHRFRFPSKH